MIKAEWLDALSVHLATDLSRRGVFRASAGLAAALGLATAGRSSVGKKQKKKKGNGRKPRPKPKPNQSCSQGDCARQWTGNQSEIDYCEFICRQCDGDDPRDFCIVAHPESGGPDKAAVCCAAEFTCCGSECAHLPNSKFHCGRCNNPCPIGSDCLAGECLSLCGPDGMACPEDLATCCRPPMSCCPGFGCVNTAAHPRNCGSCGNPCGIGQSCIDGRCERRDPPGWEWCLTDSGWVGLYTSGPLADNRWHCGGCNIECPGSYLKGQWCLEGSCSCGSNRHWCGVELGCQLNSTPC